MRNRLVDVMGESPNEFKTKRNNVYGPERKPQFYEEHFYFMH